MSENNSHTGDRKAGGKDEAEERNGENGDRAVGGNKNYLEWTVFAVSVLLVTAILVYLGYRIFTHQDGPPDIEVAVQHSPTDIAFNRYHVFLHNRGGKTAETVLVEFELQRGDSVLEKAELQVQYVPKSSSREGWINFSVPPAENDSVAARVVSFKSPS